MFRVNIDKNNNPINRFELQNYKNKVECINSINLEMLDSLQLLESSRELMKAASSQDFDKLLVDAFALVKEAAKRVLGLNVHDEQLIAGMAMYEGKLIEMYTGEGKTLSAVFPAYLYALSGKKVHILTFNDYLASRDAHWMGPIFRSLGFTTGCIQEGMGRAERRDAYNKDILYATAREIGFDYLRNFLCYDKEDLIEIPLDYAIIDEADSILIDEARIPLVIAENEAEANERLGTALSVIRELKKGIDYDTDEYGRTVYFTEKGIEKIEARFCCGNLYSQENLRLLTELNNLLYAEVLLKRDVDYIVRNNKIEMVDEFTGRIADKRQWQEGLQAAIEIKEGLKVQSKGRVINQITIQSFISLYGKLAGMTGTAVDSRGELKEVYDLDVLVIPPHKECIRVDYPDAIFTHKKAKYKALVDETARFHRKGQPVLIGTSSVSESIEIADELREVGIPCQVLNARNDEFEAQIIEKAGELGTVTVSTNMAGRGTDIKLGGVNEKDRDVISQLGGLYVIGCCRHESIRIDKQLRGRAGRQSDPGMSRFFISLEDDLIRKYGIENMLPRSLIDRKENNHVEDLKVRKKIEHIQRIIEGQNNELRRLLWRYSFVVEKQRQHIHQRRTEILTDSLPLNLLERKNIELYRSLCKSVGAEKIKLIEKRVTLYYIDECWSEHLIRLEMIRDGIHLNVLGGKDPNDAFCDEAARAFMELEEEIQLRILDEFENLDVSEDGLKSIEDRFRPPSATCTYLVMDNSFEESLGLMLQKNKNSGFAAVAMVFMGPFILAGLLYERFFKKKMKK